MLGLSINTVKDWFSVLEASYVIIRLQPYFENMGKRIVKSPKLYFVDVGLAAYLLGMESPQQINKSPAKGALFENMVVLELIKIRSYQGHSHNLYFFRDNHQNEVDLIYKKGDLLFPIEIKASHTYQTQYTKGIKYFQKLTPERSPKGYIIYAGENGQSVSEIELLNYQCLHEIFK